MDFNLHLIRTKIEKALRASEYISDENAKEIAGHFTVWMDDLDALCRFYHNPEEFENENVEEILIDFLFHAPDHLAAAKKLLTGVGVSDVFKVGAVEIPQNSESNSL
jgi:hypothetical protein